MNSVNKIKLIFSIVYILLSFYVTVFFVDVFTKIEYLSSGNIAELQNHLNIITLISLIIMLISSKLTYKKYITGFTIFLLFMLVFNLGQPLMWSMNIFSNNQLGLSTHIRKLTPSVILLATAFSLSVFSLFMLGMYLGTNKKQVKKIEIINDSNYKFVAVIMFLISAPAVILRAYQIFIFATTASYTDIYYGDFEQGGLLLYFEFLFFPSIVLIQLFFSKKSLISVSSIVVFIIYMVFYALIGDRGNWLYKLIALILLVLVRKDKKTKLKFVVTLIILAMIVYPLIDTIVDYRNNLDFTKIFQESLLKYNLQSYIEMISSPIFEMGQSMRIQAFILQDKLYLNWEHGNSYVSGLLNMVLPRIKTWFGYPDYYIENWFSQEYLGLTNYGAGFTNIGELLVNFGPYGSLLGAIIIGYLYGIIINYRNLSNKKNIFIAIVSLSILLGTARGTMEYFLRFYFWGIIFPLFCVFILEKVKFKGLK